MSLSRHQPGQRRQSSSARPEPQPRGNRSTARSARTCKASAGRVVGSRLKGTEGWSCIATSWCRYRQMICWGVLRGRDASDLRCGTNSGTHSPDAPAFHVSIQAQNGQPAIELGGEMDVAAVEELRLVVAQMDQASNQAAVVDLSALTFCDPAGVNELIDTSAR